MSLHTHTAYSDGSAKPEAYLETALQKGIRTLGFSDHSPLPFENTFALCAEETQAYCDAVRRLQREWKGRVDVFLGMEIDYIPGIGRSPDDFRTSYNLDYLIGSVHLVQAGPGAPLWFIDGPRAETYDHGLKEFFGGDIRRAVTAYYRAVCEMVETYRPEILGHMDKIKMHNKGRFFREDEPWYVALTEEALDCTARAGTVLEVNTRGLYKKRSDSLFPGPEILKKAKKLGIPVIISSDAHKPEEIGAGARGAAETLRAAGYREERVLTPQGWADRPL
jgi:histidinol-phosphatase (PHP family)